MSENKKIMTEEEWKNFLRYTDKGKKLVNDITKLYWESKSIEMLPKEGLNKK